MFELHPVQIEAYILAKFKVTSLEQCKMHNLKEQVPGMCRAFDTGYSFTNSGAGAGCRVLVISQKLLLKTWFRRGRLRRRYLKKVLETSCHVDSR